MDRPLESNGHMDRHPQNDWASVRYDARFDEYWVEAGNARQLLFYCPWCGDKLPPSRRDDWFDALEAAGIDPLGDSVPDAYRTGAWRGAAVERVVREPGALSRGDRSTSSRRSDRPGGGANALPAVSSGAASWS